MTLKILGWQHLLTLAVFFIVCIPMLVCAKLFLKTEKRQKIFMKCLGIVLLVFIVTNRFSVVFKSDPPQWNWLIPDSFCRMSSLVLALALILGKKDNPVLHFVWLISLAGGLIVMFYPEFLPQNPSIFYLPTISGLLHHWFAVIVVSALFIFKYFTITYKKWYCTPLGFACYLSVGGFLITVMGYHDAFSMVTPLLNGTPLTVWIVAPIYLTVYAFILLGFELVRKLKKKKKEKTASNTQI